MKLTLLATSIYCFLFFGGSYAQVGIGTNTPNASAALDVSSTNKALLPPRMTLVQIQAIPNPVAGMIVFDTDARFFRFYNGNSWILMSSKQQALSDAPGNFTSTKVSGTGSLYWYYTPSGRTKVGADKSLYFVAALGIGNVTFGSTNIVNPGGSYGAVFAKMDSVGNPLWMKSLESSSSVSIYDLDVDAAGNVYLAGSIAGTTDFNPGPATNSVTPAGPSDGFIAKYDTNGNFTWVQKVGGTGTEYVKSICTDGTTVFFCGDQNSSFTWGGGAASQTGTGQNVFVARAQASDGLPGASGWIRTAYCSANNACESRRVKLYGGSLLWCGNYNSTINFTGGYTKTSAGNQDCYFAVYNAFGGTSASNIVSYGGPNADFVYDMAASSAGNIYLTGFFTGSISFSATNLTGPASFSNGYVARYNSSLANTLSYKYGGSNGADQCYTIAVDNAENVYVGGLSSSTDINILGRNPSAGTSYSTAFLLKLNSNLYPAWFNVADSYSSYYYDYLNGVDVSPDGKTVFSTMSVGDNSFLIGFDGVRQPSTNWFYLSLYRE